MRKISMDGLNLLIRDLQASVKPCHFTSVTPKKTKKSSVWSNVSLWINTYEIPRGMLLGVWLTLKCPLLKVSQRKWWSNLHSRCRCTLSNLPNWWKIETGKETIMNLHIIHHRHNHEMGIPTHLLTFHPPCHSNSVIHKQKKSPS